jgi:hypothetical protein
MRRDENEEVAVNGARRWSSMAAETCPRRLRVGHWEERKTKMVTSSLL